MAIELLAAITASDLLWWVDVIFKVAVALGAVVFVHELGHFLAAKACGVKVDKFMVGFDIGGYKIAKQFGETVYGIGILPLGGYVKMFGQDDDPSHIAEQMQNSQVAANSADAVEKVGPNGEKYFIDRRSYLAKSVPQRMLIISAGVIMNIITAFIFATIAYSMGVKYLPSVVSETMPGSPAWQAGLMPGDEIVQLGDRKDPTFLQLKGGVTLGNLETGIPCLIERAASGEVVPVTLKPTQQAGELATVGIGGPMSLELVRQLPVLKGSAASQAKRLEGGSTPATNNDQTDKKDKKDAKADPTKLQGGDTIVSINDVPVEQYSQFIAEAAKNFDKPVVIGVRRPLEDAKQSTNVGSEEQPSETLRFEVPPQPLRDLGLVMAMGPITAIQKGSLAEQAGFETGDVIEQVDGKPSAENPADTAGWTPITLPEYLQRAGAEGREVEFQIRRGASKDNAGGLVTLRVKPVVPTTIHNEIPLDAPIAADAVGFAYRVSNTVHTVVPASAAATGGVAPGDVIASAQIRYPKPEEGKAQGPIDIELGDKNYSWPALVDAIQFAPADTKIAIKLDRGEKNATEVVLEPQVVEGQYIASRGYIFMPVFRTRQASSFGEAVRLGFEETIEALTMVFRFLQKLGSQVPFKMLGGPGTIAVAAGDAASQGIAQLLIFLTMLSANLAVINFLPIPVLDGGHMVFLLYEGLRGRPANEKVVMGLHMAGFAFILSLMIFVIGLDIQRWIIQRWIL